MKKFLCLLLCFLVAFCFIACSKNPEDSSSYSTIVEEIIEGVENSNTANENTSSENNNISSLPYEENTVSNNSSVITDSSVENTPKYNFKSVEYYFIKNIPQSDIILTVTDIVTDDDTVFDRGFSLSCDDNNVKIDDRTITVPYQYKEQQKPLILKIRFFETRQTFNYQIKFDENWEKVFGDEFDGTQLDLNVWQHSPEWLRNKGYVNYWSKDLTFLDGNGHLVSRAQPGKKTVNGSTVDAYLSGAIGTKQPLDIAYGYYEVKAKLHHTTGMWGAFWLRGGDMGSNNPANDDSSRNGCEIDVFESLYNHGGVSQNLHWDGYKGFTKSAPANGAVKQINTFDNEYHTFAVSWTPYEYVYLVDGIITRRIDEYEGHGICDQPGNLFITTECGTWAGEFTLKEGEYSDMLVDYVRVYQYFE